MAFSPMNSVLYRLRQMVGPAGGEDASDAQLLAGHARGDADAFEQLVRRHGRLVFGVCRRVLGNEHDADDAFQATFMVLARKAGSLSGRESLSGWLYGVACRTAKKARLSADRRRKREEAAATMNREPIDDATPENRVGPMLDEEVNRLPEKYRLPLLLCYLEGESNEEAARRIRCSTSAVKMRLLRARELLRSRLERRGLAVSALALGTLLDSQATSAAVPELLMSSTFKAATAFAAGSVAGAEGAAALAQGVIQDMSLTKMKLAVVVVIGMGALGIGIGMAVQGKEPSAPAVAEAADKDTDKPAPPKAADKPAPERKEGPIDEKASAAARNNRFGFELLGKAAAPDKNAFLSPYSISAALSMTYAGARGDTAAEMASTLHFSPDQEKWHPTFAGLSAGLKPGGDKPPYELHVANRLWGAKNAQFHEAFLKTTRDHYGAGIEPVDFKANPEAGRKLINTWVEEQTKDKIKELIQKGMIDEDTRLVLTNAIYFKSQWEHAFVKERTKPKDFRRPGADAVKVPMMSVREMYRYAETDAYQVLDLPYRSNALSMVIVLPKKVDGLAAVEKDLTGARLAEILEKLKRAQVDVSLPKFKLTESYPLEKTLQEMGMKKPFDAQFANFSGISSEPLYISKVIHKALVDVDENGTEAAAATAVIMRPTSAIVVDKTVTFNADHPFLFLIRDNKTGAVLFLGRLVNPA